MGIIEEVPYLLSANSPAGYVKIQSLEDVEPCKKNRSSSKQPMHKVPRYSADLTPETTWNNHDQAQIF